jgi:hypothetical protein
MTKNLSECKREIVRRSLEGRGAMEVTKIEVLYMYA